MAKYSFEFKLQVVQDYYSGVGGKRFLAKKYGITPKQVAVWKNIYKEFGALGLQRKRQNTVYSTQFKINAVNLYLTSEFSYREVSNQLNINNPALVTGWVTKYREKGELAFSKPRGRPGNDPPMPQYKQKKKSSSLSTAEHELAKLQNENLNLRMENECLKGLRRLRMEQQAKENPDLFKTSKDNISSPLNNS